jgi:L-fuconolactonase
LPWTEGAAPLDKTYSSNDYLNATAGLGVGKAIYMEVDVQDGQREAEAEFIIDLCQRDDNPTYGAVISGRPFEDGFRSYVDIFSNSECIKGIRQVLHADSAPRGFCLEKKFVANIRFLGEVGLRFDLCMRAGELADAVALADACPGTRFVVDHCGNADPNVINSSHPGDTAEAGHNRDQWMKDMGSLGERKNVVCKISGIVARAQPQWSATDLAPTVDHCLESFGPDRVIFGGDWPVCTVAASFREWVDALRSIVAHRPTAEREKLWHENAEQFYELE